MTNKVLNQLLNTITENRGNEYYILKLTELAFNLSQNNMVDSEFKEQLFHTVENKVNLESKKLYFKWDYFKLLLQMYKKGIGVKKNPQAAFDCLIKMVKVGNNTAAKEIVFAYKDGNEELNIKPDKEEMISWCFKATEYSCPLNLYFLALQAVGKKVPLFYDLGITKSLPLAIKCLETLTKYDCERLDLIITTDFEILLGEQTIPFLEEFSESALLKDVEKELWNNNRYTGINSKYYSNYIYNKLLNLLGKAYVEIKDYQNAINTFKKAMSHNSLTATLNMSNVYHNGLGLIKNEEQAFSLKKRVIDSIIYGVPKLDWDLLYNEEKNLLEAIISVAEAYRYGIGVQKSLSEALKYYSQIKSAFWILNFYDALQEEIANKAIDDINEILKSEAETV